MLGTQEGKGGVYVKKPDVHNDFHGHQAILMIFQQRASENTSLDVK